MNTLGTTCRFPVAYFWGGGNLYSSCIFLCAKWGHVSWRWEGDWKRRGRGGRSRLGENKVYTQTEWQSEFHFHCEGKVSDELLLSFVIFAEAVWCAQGQTNKTRLLLGPNFSLYVFLKALSTSVNGSCGICGLFGGVGLMGSDSTMEVNGWMANQHHHNPTYAGTTGDRDGGLRKDPCATHRCSRLNSMKEKRRNRMRRRTKIKVPPRWKMMKSLEHTHTHTHLPGKLCYQIRKQVNLNPSNCLDGRW